MMLFESGAFLKWNVTGRTCGYWEGRQPELFSDLHAIDVKVNPLRLCGIEFRASQNGATNRFAVARVTLRIGEIQRRRAAYERKGRSCLKYALSGWMSTPIQSQ